jgi:hypothetical protein
MTTKMKRETINENLFNEPSISRYEETTGTTHHSFLTGYSNKCGWYITAIPYVDWAERQRKEMKLMGYYD